MAQPVIVVNHLTRRFGDLVAVNGLTVTVERGEVFGLLGHNGAGKTTTVRLLNGVLTPHAGQVQVLGYDPVQEGPALRRHTGVLTETPSLYEQLSGRDNLRIFADLYGVPSSDVNGQVEKMLSFFALADRGDELTGGYSKGMKQRLALARAFLHEPELLFLDEATAGLDPVAAKHVNDLIREISREEGRTVVLATHNLYDAQRLCDRVAVLEQGRVVAMGTPAELIQQAAYRVQVEFVVASGQVDAARTVLARFSDDLQVDAGTALITLPRLDHERIPEALSALVNQGVQVYKVAPSEPTLEDVYFALHGEHNNNREKELSI